MSKEKKDIENNSGDKNPVQMSAEHIYNLVKGVQMERNRFESLIKEVKATMWVNYGKGSKRFPHGVIKDINATPEKMFIEIVTYYENQLNNQPNE